MKLLGGTEKVLTMKENGTERKIGEEEDGTTVVEIRGEIHERNEQEEERELEEGEIADAVKRMKLGKAAGIDGIPMEALRFCGSAVGSCLVDLIKQIWKEGTIPSEWKISIVVPLYKRGDKEKAENYRGISLLCSAYKVYAEILRNRLEEVIEAKGMLPESQAGFRKGRSTMDNIFILNHIVQREKGKKRGDDKVHALFIDLKAAFDNVDRGKLWEVLEQKGVDSSLLNRIKGLYEETETSVRTSRGMTRNFITKKGVRQGCVLSPDLFSLYIADLDEALEKRNIGGIVLGMYRVWSLAYADDMVLLAKNKEALDDMMDTLKRFLKDRKLDLSTEKTKVMIFNSGGKLGKRNWKWGKERIEEVKSFKYLGFTFNRKGNYTDHIKEMGRKGRLAANKVWGLGERICKDDFKRRRTLFNYLVKSVMEYGVEVWGWVEKSELEKIWLDYIRWIFGIEFCTPRYIILRELSLKKLKIEWGLRAMRYEKRSRESSKNRLIAACWEEKDKVEYNSEYGKKDLFSSEREDYFNNLGWGLEAIRTARGEDIDMFRVIREREQDIQEQIIDNKVRNARYNKRYKELGIACNKPRYLSNVNMDKSMSGDGIRALIRLRCGNMEEANKYWLEEDVRNCGFCKLGRDNLEHYIGECTVISDWFVNLGKSYKERLDTLCNDELGIEKGRILKRLWKEKEGKRKQVRT